MLHNGGSVPIVSTVEMLIRDRMELEILPLSSENKSAENNAALVSMYMYLTNFKVLSGQGFEWNEDFKGTC